MTIENIETPEMIEIIAGLIKQGLTFKCIPQPGQPSGIWKIIFDGGY